MKNTKKLKPLKKIKKLDDLVGYDKSGKRNLVLGNYGVWQVSEDMSEVDQ